MNMNKIHVPVNKGRIITSAADTGSNLVEEFTKALWNLGSKLSKGEIDQAEYQRRADMLAMMDVCPPKIRQKIQDAKKKV